VAKILILEDDATMSDWLQESIERDFVNMNPEVEVLESESEFVLQWVPQFEKSPKHPPDVIVIDIMLKWTSPARNQPPRPLDAIKGGYVRGGLRCFDLIRNHHLLSRSHVILLTILTKNDLDNVLSKEEREAFRRKLEHAELIHKEKDDGQAVLNRIGSALGRTR